MKFKTVKRCRYCGEESFSTVLDLGDLYPSNFVTEETALDTGDKVPLQLIKCNNCDLVQLEHEVDRDKLYRQYWYRSGLNQSMVEALKDIIEDVKYFLEYYMYSRRHNKIIVDIGCNDGTMLGLLDTEKTYKVGFDPAKNLAKEAEENCDLFINDYFSAEAYLKTGLPRADIITAIAMFYDLPNVDEFMNDISRVLNRDGIFIIQLTDLTTTLKINAIDNVCHEHLEYYTLNFLQKMARQHFFSIIGVKKNEVNGGSIRVFFRKDGEEDANSQLVDALIDEYKYYKKDSIEELQERIEYLKEELVEFISTKVGEGKTIAVMGASTKGNTLLQYYGIDNTLIDHAAEVNEEKFGLKTIGTNIPIISEKESLKKNPDYYLVLPWHFIDNFIERNKTYLENGGRFIVPLPTPLVYYINDTGEVEWTTI